MQKIKLNYRSHVLVCSHNGEKYIYAQIKSLIQQSMQVNCIHVYDFNSSDRTLEEIERIKKNLYKYPRVNLYVTQIHETPGANKSFDYALKDLFNKLNPDDYVFFCDQDDVWLPFKNKTIYEFLLTRNNNKDPILIHHDVSVVDKNLENLKDSYYDNSQKSLLNSPYKLNIHFGLAIGHTICINYRAAQILSKIDYNENILMYDWFWTSIIEQIGYKYFIDKSLSKYRQHESNLIGVNENSGTTISKIIKFLDHSNNIAVQNILIKEILNEFKMPHKLSLFNTISQYFFLIFRVNKIKVIALKFAIDYQILKNNFISFFNNKVKS